MSATTNTPLYCQSCHAEARPGFRFCPRCGHTQFAPQAAAVFTAQVPSQPAAGAMGYAGFWRRFAAFAIDWLLCGALSYVVVELLVSPWFKPLIDGPTLEVTDPPLLHLLELDTAGGITTWVLHFVVIAAYYVFQEAGRHQAALGKRAMGLIVADMQGQRISHGQAFGRWAATLLSTPFFAGYLLSLFTQRRQTLHDLMAGTVVLYRGQ